MFFFIMIYTQYHGVKLRFDFGERRLQRTCQPEDIVVHGLGQDSCFDVYIRF